MTCRSGEPCLRRSTSSPGTESRAFIPSAVRPRLSTRDQERETSGRGGTAGRLPPMTASCMRTRSRAWVGRLRPGGTALCTTTVTSRTIASAAQHR